MRLLDATLREGAQRSGQAFSVDQKVEAARVLAGLGVDAIQVGFPIARDGSAEVCERLDVDAELVGIGRALERDIDAAAEAGVDVVEFGVPMSDIQREHILGGTAEEAIETAVEIYEHGRDHGLSVNVSAQDAFRAEPADLTALAEAVAPATFTLLDTVGAATPALVDRYLEAVSCPSDQLGVHFHNDLGVAEANVLTAAAYGVEKADVTVGGIGERVGNAALEEVVVAGTVGEPTVEFGLELDELIPACRRVLDILDESVSPHKPVLGRTAFEHESGMHTATMLDEPALYEAFDPGAFGGERRLLFGPSSGKGAARRLLVRAGGDPTDDDVDRFLDELKSLDEHVELETATEMAEDALTGGD